MLGDASLHLNHKVRDRGATLAFFPNPDHLAHHLVLKSRHSTAGHATVESCAATQAERGNAPPCPGATPRKNSIVASAIVSSTRSHTREADKRRACGAAPSSSHMLRDARFRPLLQGHHLKHPQHGTDNSLVMVLVRLLHMCTEYLC